MQIILCIKPQRVEGVSHQNVVLPCKSYPSRENYRNCNKGLKHCNWPGGNAIFREMCSRSPSYCRTEPKP